MVSSLLTTTLSASSDSDFRLLTAYRLGAETPSPPTIFLLSPTLAESARTLSAWEVCRGTAGDEYCNGVAGGWYFFGFSSRPSRFQFEITALTAICSLELVLSLPVRVLGITTSHGEAVGGDRKSTRL